jgi:hypothetical protein
LAGPTATGTGDSYEPDTCVILPVGSMSSDQGQARTGRQRAVTSLVVGHHQAARARQGRLVPPVRPDRHLQLYVVGWAIGTQEDSLIAQELIRKQDRGRICGLGTHHHIRRWLKGVGERFLPDMAHAVGQRRQPASGYQGELVSSY